MKNIVYDWSQRAGLRPQKEAPNLLLPQSPDDLSATLRRPADVFLPALAGSPAALDFAVTAPQRQETLAQASRTPGSAAAAYASHKATYLNTAELCRQNGILFVPMVAETTGAWDPGALKVLRHVAHAVAARTGQDAATTLNALLQELGVAIRTHRARAVLRRRSELHQ